MPYDGVMNDIRTAIDLGQPARLPVLACSEEFDVHWYGKYSYEEVCQDGDKMAEVWIAAIEEFGYDWAWVQIDDCFEFEPLGVGCVGEGDILRATKDYLPATRDTLAGLSIPDPQTAGRMPEKLKAIRLIRERFGDSVCVVGGCAAPYSSVGLLFGLEETMIQSITDPQLLLEACDFFVESQAVWCRAQIEAGAHSIWLGDCNAFSDMLSVEQYVQFAFPSASRLTGKIHDAGGLVHVHNSEIRAAYLSVEAEMGADILNVGPAGDMNEIAPVLAGKNCFSGNLDPIEVLMRGTPEHIESEVRRIINICRPGGGYLFCTGEMNPRDVPEENMRALVAAVRKYGGD